MDELACNASFTKEVCMFSITLAVLYDTFVITPLSHLYEAMENVNTSTFITVKYAIFGYLQWNHNDLTWGMLAQSFTGPLTRTDSHTDVHQTSLCFKILKNISVLKYFPNEDVVQEYENFSCIIANHGMSHIYHSLTIWSLSVIIRHTLSLPSWVSHLLQYNGHACFC